MKIEFKHGFNYKGVLYGWKDKQLYRLPTFIKKRFYPLKELKTWKRNGIDVGYYVGQERKSFVQLKSMTISINKKIDIIEDDDLPF